MTPTPITPQIGEVWIHSVHGPVELVKKWNATESVCETKRGRKLLHHALMAARYEDIEGAGYRLTYPSGTTMTFAADGKPIEEPQ